MKRQGMWIGLFSTMLVVLPTARGQENGQPQRLDVTTWPAGVAKKSELPSAKAIDYSFTDIKASEIEGWLSWVGVEIPVDVSGSFSGWLWAQRSQRGWLNFSGYRIEGQISSPLLRIEKWEFRQAQLRFGYANSRWYIGRLAGEVASMDSTQAIGHTVLAATMPQNSPRILQISGKVDRTRIEALLRSFGVDINVENEAATLTADARVPLESVSDLASWTAVAVVEIEGVRSKDIPRSGLNATVTMSAGEWQMSDARLTVVDEPIEFKGQGEIGQQLPFSASFEGRQLSLSQLLKAGKQSSLAERMTGNIDAVGAVRGDIEHGIVTASAAVRSKSIRIDNEALQNVLIESVLDNRTTDAESLVVNIQTAAIAGSNLQGEMRWDSLKSLEWLLPDRASIRVDNLELAKLPQALLPVDVLGLAKGQVELSTTRSRLGEPVQWGAQGDLTVSQLAIMGTTIGDTTLNIAKPIDSDRMRVEGLAAQGTVKAAVEVVLNSGEGLPGTIRSYSATGNMQDFRTQLPLSVLGESMPMVAHGSFRVQGERANWLATGNAELAQLVVELDGQSIELNDLLLNIGTNALRLERFTVRDERGRIAGSALIRRDGIGEHLLNLRVVGVEIEPYITSFAPSLIHGLVGVIGIEARFRKAAAASDLISEWSGTFEGAVEELEYRSTPLGQVTVRGTVDPERIQGTAHGSMLGGELHLGGEAAIENFLQDAQHATGESFTASLSGVQLNRLMALAYGSQLGNRYAGAADIAMESGARNSEKGLHIHLGIPNFSYERREIANDLFAELQYVDGSLLVKELSGGLASGRIELDGDVNFAAGQTIGGFKFSINRVELNGITALLFPEYADNYSGVVTYRGHARVGDEVALIGAAHLVDVLVYHLPIQDVRSDLTIGLTSSGELLSLHAQNAHGTALGGRFDGEGSLRGGAHYSLNAQGKIGHGKLEQLSRALGFEHIVGSGSFNASTRLSSTNAGSFASLSGPLQLEFEDGDAQSVPLLADIGRLVPIIQLASTEITSGTLHGQFGQGQLRVDDLLLNSEAFWLVAKGSASLVSQRLDFEALLQTGGGIDDRLLQAGSQKLLAIALPQLALLSELNELVSNRTLYFHIGGTTKHPVIQPKAAQTAAKALLQNVARQLLIAPTVAAAQGNTN